MVADGQQIVYLAIKCLKVPRVVILRPPRPKRQDQPRLAKGPRRLIIAARRRLPPTAVVITKATMRPDHRRVTLAILRVGSDIGGEGAQGTGD